MVAVGVRQTKTAKREKKKKKSEKRKGRKKGEKEKKSGKKGPLPNKEDTAILVCTTPVSIAATLAQDAGHMYICVQTHMGRRKRGEGKEARRESLAERGKDIVSQAISTCAFGGDTRLSRLRCATPYIRQSIYRPFLWYVSRGGYKEQQGFSPFTFDTV